MKFCAMIVTLILFCAARACFAADGSDIVARHVAIFDRPPSHVPTNGMPDGPLLGNGDVGVVLAGPPEDQKFYIGKNDFWRRGDASVETVGTIGLSIPALQDATYRQEQDMAKAEVRGTFAKGDNSLQVRSWVDANENLLVTKLHCTSHAPLEIGLRQFIGEEVHVPAQIADSDSPVNIGREMHGGGRWYFNGNIDAVSIENRALAAREIRTIASKGHDDPAAKKFDGRVFETLQQPRMDKSITVAAWIKIESVNSDANYIVSKGDWDQAYSLGLAAGCLRWSINGTYVQTQKPLELHKWLYVAGTFDGHRMHVYVDGAAKPALGGAGSEVDETLATAWYTRAADAMPGSRQVAVVSRILGGAVHLDSAGGLSATLQPGQSLTIATAVLSDLDAKDDLAAAKQLVAALQPADLDSLSARHQAWWKDFWSKSFIEIPDKEIEKRWYAALYAMGSCSRPGKVAPGLWGNWATTDHPNWHGDFHLNYNFQAPYYMVYSANHADLSLPFYQAMLESVPNGQAMAKRHGWKGIHFPVCIGPWGMFPENPDQDWGQRSDSAFAGLNFIWYYQYTQDTEFLRKTTYPYLRQVADFWEDYLKFENGRYVIYNDSIHEGSGPDFNPLLSLGLVRTLFKNMIPMSQELGVDADRRAKWQDICDKISAFPTQEMNGKTVFRYSEKGMGWNGGNTLGIHHIFPAGAIGLDSDPKLLAISRNMIDAMHRWADYNGFSSWYTACARVGYDPKIILARLRDECDKHSFPNLLLYYGGGGIENCGGFLAINEMLLQSHDGVIRLFPDWPKDLNARFGDLRTVGAFLVSAEQTQGIIEGIKMTSEKGGPCTMQNPWPGKTIHVIRNGKPAEIATGERFTFKTATNESIELKPE
jgi:alpha-L-fucosidase 2